MKKKSKEMGSNSLKELRTEAEVYVIEKKNLNIADYTEKSLIYELQVHQIELQMQNEQLRQVQMALEESRDLYLNLYEFAPVGYMTLDKDGRIVEANLKSASLLGIERKDILQKFLSKFLMDVDKDLWYLTFTRHKLLTADDSFFIEIRFNHATGGTLYLRLNCLRLEENDKQHLFRLTLIDITKEKKEEQERLINEKKLRKALVSEVHHRIKNTLQGVTGLMNSHVVNHPELLNGMNDAISKLQSIATVHGLQGEHSNTEIPLQDLITNIANCNQSLFQRPLILDIPSTPVWLIKEEESVPIALVLNELVFNAIKHSTKNTAITISMKEEQEKNTVLILIRNHGRLSQDSKKPHEPILGTGLQLINALLPKVGVGLSWQQIGDFVSVALLISSPVTSQSV